MLSLCMIVKNEIKYIEDCLKAIKPYVDEIIVADTGSTDGTIEILEKYDCQIYNFEWCNDYSKARNFAISKSTNNWVIILDADEQITDFNENQVNKIIKLNKGEVIGLIELRSFVGDASSVRTDQLPRLFNKKYYTFFRDIHEVPVPKFSFKEQYVNTGIKANHFGYLESTRSERGKNEKYLEDLQRSLSKKYDPYIVHHLAGTYLNLKMFNEAITEADKILNDTHLANELYFSDVAIIKIKALSQLQKYQEALNMQTHFKYCQANDDYLYSMAYIFLKNNLFDTALDIYTYLSNKKDLTISRLEAINGLASVNFEMGNYQEALNQYTKLEKLDGIKEKIELCRTLLK